MNLALIFAGGTGTRMNSKTKPKQFLELNGKPIIIHTIELFESHPEIDAIAVVCLESWIGYLNELLERFRIKTNLIHNSAVNLSLCVDNSWHIDEAIEALREAGFDVMKAENMELLTVRGYTDELWRKYARGPQVFVRQATQSTVRVVRKRS